MTLNKAGMLLSKASIRRVDIDYMSGMEVEGCRCSIFRCVWLCGLEGDRPPL
jgi:hypothetical protein